MQCQIVLSGVFPTVAFPVLEKLFESKDEGKSGGTVGTTDRGTGYEVCPEYPYPDTL